MCLTKIKIFIIWPFRRKRLPALVLVAGDAMNKTDQNILLFWTLNSIYTFIFHRIRIHLSHLHSTYI